VEGLVRALDKIEAVISLIRASRSLTPPGRRLVDACVGFTEPHAQAIGTVASSA
jgi:DNA gyrase/topoisomerase IV subunit A